MTVVPYTFQFGLGRPGLITGCPGGQNEAKLQNTSVSVLANADDLALLAKSTTP